MPINNTEATGAAIAAPGSRPVYTADVVIKDATEAYTVVLHCYWENTPKWRLIAYSLSLYTTPFSELCTH